MSTRSELTIVERPVRKLTQLERIRLAVRSYWSGPITSNSPEIARLLGSGPTTSGISVDEWTATNYSAVWAAVGLISDDIASLPLFLYKRLPTGGKDRYEDHPLYRLLHDAPNPEMTTSDWRRCQQGHVLIWGNAYAEIERDQTNRPVAIWPITPDRVTPYRRSSNAPLQYRVRNDSGGETILDAADVLHIKGRSFNGITGDRVMEKMRESIALALAAEKFGSSFFGNGSTFGGVISYPTDPSDEVKKSNREVLARRHQGIDNAHKFLALYGGAKFEQLGVPPNNAQFHELRVDQVREACRWFKVPPPMLGDLADATFSNVEQLVLLYYTSCLRNWCVTWEQELGRKLIAKLEQKQQFVEHLVDGLLRGDVQGRGEFYSKLFNIGAITINEIRDRENLDPIEGGDTTFVPLNTIPLSMAEEWAQAEIDSKKTPPAPKVTTPPQEPTPTRDDLIREIGVLNAEVQLARQKAQGFEDRCDILKGELEAAQSDVLRQAEDFQTTIRAREESIKKLDETVGALELECERLAGEANAEKETAEGLAVDVATLRHEVDNARHDVEVRDAKIAEINTYLKNSQNRNEELAKRADDLLALADTHAKQRDEAITRVITLDQTIADLTADVTRKQETIESLSLDVTVARQDHAKETARAQQIEAEKATADALLAELRLALNAANVERLAAQAAVTEARELLARTDTAHEETQKRLEDADKTIEERAAAMAFANRLLDETRAAIRLVLIDTFQRLIDFEAERARGQYGTPEKFTKWLGNFYGPHAERCRTALKPILKAWMTAAAVDVPLDTVIDAHIDASRVALQIELDGKDPDTLAPAIEKILRKWEDSRAEAAADAITRRAA